MQAGERRVHSSSNESRSRGLRTVLQHSDLNDETDIPDASDRARTQVFVRTHIGWMLQLARRYLRETALAEDAVQNAFTKVFAKADQFEGKSGIRGWMRRIVVNEALMLLRKRKASGDDAAIDLLLPRFDRNDCRIEEPWSTLPTPEQLLVNKQSRQLVLDAIDNLPASYRAVLLLRDIEERSTAEVADLLEISEANVKIRLHRARAALKSLLEPVMRKGGLPE